MKDARLYHCVRCQHQCIICSDCDRGNIYCGSACAKKSRTQNHRIANRTYQKTFRGSQKHAARQKRYRLRQKEKTKKVTDRSSALISQNDLLPATENGNKKITSEQIHCHFCGKNVRTHLRNGYLRYFEQINKNKLIRFNDTG